MTLHRFRRADLPAQPWKNGGGLTREVVSLPAAGTVQTAPGADFSWRVSIAHLTRSGPFSTFAGVDRVITLLEGPGLHLRSADGAIDHRLDTALAPFAFAGEAQVQAELLGGEGHDLNVMTRRDLVRARVLVVREATALPPCGQGLVLAVQGRWRLNAGNTLTRSPHSAEPLQADEGLWWHGRMLAWQLQPEPPEAAPGAVPEASAVVVLIEPVAA